MALCITAKHKLDPRTPITCETIIKQMIPTRFRQKIGTTHYPIPTDVHAALLKQAQWIIWNIKWFHNEEAHSSNP